MDIFDILGPVMVGPSSSHTAGAVRIGSMARTLLGTAPKKAAIHLYGSFADTGLGHGTDRALVAGLLGMKPDDLRIPYAFEAAKAFFQYLFEQKGARRIYAYTEDYNLSSQHLCEKLGMRQEGFFKEFISFVKNPDGTPKYENTLQYAILKKEWERMS